VKSFDEACRFLFRRTAGGIKWGLETTSSLLDSLGHPERHFATVHVGGTNGKGSTSAFLAAMLRAQGFRVGLYTSPHLVSFTERMLVDGQPAAEEAVAAWVERLEPLALDTEASFFEITTAVAFADFAARGAEIAVVEVGLGGRLDATNVITPLACGVTRIAREHTEYLGEDLLGIAREKAGIAKPGIPFFTTEQNPELAAAMELEAARRGSKVARVDPHLAAGFALGLTGAHQVANASLAVALARSLRGRFAASEDAIREGLAAARLPGRFDRRGRWLFDVAHNPDGMRALAGALRAAMPPAPVWAVVAVLKDKEWRAMLELLAPEVDVIVLTCAPSAPPDRAWDPHDALRWCWESGLTTRGERGRHAVVAEPDFDAALAAASSGGGHGTTLVTGSFHTVGDALARLPGFAPLG
jgi:dihydrofolate synthase/folylpolyglutamate synthase